MTWNQGLGAQRGCSDLPGTTQGVSDCGELGLMWEERHMGQKGWGAVPALWSSTLRPFPI